MFRVFNFKQIQQEQELQLICKTVNWCILCCLKLAQLIIFLQTDAIYLNYSELNWKMTDCSHIWRPHVITFDFDIRKQTMAEQSQSV